MLQEPYFQYENISDCRNIAITIFLHDGKYAIPHLDRRTVRANFAKLLELDPLPGIVQTTKQGNIG